MRVRANPAFATFRRRLAANPELMRPWRGAAYRVTTLDYPSPKEILRGQGSFLYGGRWNAIGAFRAVYGSTSDVVAVAESRANADYAGMLPPYRTPRLLVTIELELPEVLDLTQPEAIRQLDVTWEKFRIEDWRKTQRAGDESLTQALGRAVFESGANGLLARSARVEDGTNVAYFPENQRTLGEAAVCEPAKLDRIKV